MWSGGIWSGCLKIIPAPGHDRVLSHSRCRSNHRAGFEAEPHRPGPHLHLQLLQRVLSGLVGRDGKDGCPNQDAYHTNDVCLE